MALIAPEGFVNGQAEPWIVDILCALLKASDQRSVLETGAFIGATTKRLALTLHAMGGGKIVACEIEPERAAQTSLVLDSIPELSMNFRCVDWTIIQDDVLKYIASVKDESIGFAFVDDDHRQEHVFEELTLLLPKMVRGGIVTGHDVHGVCQLHEVFAKFPNSISLDLPMLGPAGGLGILQVP